MKKPNPTKPLPKEILVCHDRFECGLDCFQATTNLNEIAIIGKAVTVGVYVLKETVTVKTVAEIETK